MIKVVRIDHRLLHGQVVFAWIKSQGIERIIIIDDSTASDDFRKMSLKLSKPEEVKLSVFSAEQAIERMDKINALTDNTMIIFANVNETSIVAPYFNHVKEINYGGIPDKPGAKRYSSTVYLSDDEVTASKKLKDLGYQLIMQQVPTSKSELLNNMI